MMNLLSTLQKTGEAFLNLVFPPHCVLCSAATEPRQLICRPCLATAPKIKAPFCQTCSEPFDGAIENPFNCPQCGESRFAFDCAVAAYRSAGPVREVIHRFKYQHQYHLRRPLADWLAETLYDPRLLDPAVDAIVPVPLHPARQRDRGFNQAKVLASLLSKKSGVPLLNALKRTRFTLSQTRLAREKRMENLRNAFQLSQTTKVNHRHLLLIDDVLTTGSTVNECARILKKAGAASVRVAVVARG